MAFPTRSNRPSRVMPVVSGLDPGIVAGIDVFLAAPQQARCRWPGQAISPAMTPERRFTPRCDRSTFMRVFSLTQEQEWNPKRHVEKILDRIGAGDVSLACCEPGHVSPSHYHLHATRNHFLFGCGRQMRPPR